MKAKAKKNPKLPPPRTLVREWVKALRSGRYTQTTGQLAKPDDGHCCLGVACRVVKRLVPGLVKVSQFMGLVEFNGHDSELPLEVRDVLGLQDSAGRFNGEALAYLNDRGKTFEEIADVIESRPAGLFRKDVFPERRKKVRRAV